MALEKRWIFGQLPEHGQKRLKEINLLLECSQIAEPTNNGQLEIGNLVVMSNQLHYADTDERSDSIETYTGILVADYNIFNPHLIPATSSLGRHIKGLTVSDKFGFTDGWTLAEVKGSILKIGIPTESEIKSLIYHRK